MDKAPKIADAMQGSSLTSRSNEEVTSLRYRRVVVKAGTSILTGGKERLDTEMMARLVSQVAQMHREGVEVLLVTSGAIAAGKGVLGITEDRREVSFRQVLAAIGQSHLMHTYQTLFQPHGITLAQALLTWKDLADRQGYLNVRNTLLSLLDLRVVPVINENDVVAAEEIGQVFGDNDRLSALVANLIDADLLALLTDTEGLYTADPRLDPYAKLLPRVERVDSYIEGLAWKHNHAWSRGGMPTKLEAAKLAAQSGVTTVICNGRAPGIVLRLARGEAVGTLFPPTASKVESRKRWLLSGLAIKGEITVDQGAVRALRELNRSLLPAGVKDVRGEFERGDVVYVASAQGERVACGLANYGAKDIARIKGQRSDSILQILGSHFGQEVVHRNNMVLL